MTKKKNKTKKINYINNFSKFLDCLTQDWVSCAAGGCSAKLCNEHGIIINNDLSATINITNEIKEHRKINHTWHQFVTRRIPHICRWCNQITLLKVYTKSLGKHDAHKKCMRVECTYCGICGPWGYDEFNAINYWDVIMMRKWKEPTDAFAAKH